jgi:hypothetical protein
MTVRNLAAVALVLAVGASAQAATIVLYDGSSGVMPDHVSWRWIYGSSPLEFPPTSESFASGVTTLDTSSGMDKRAGYFSEITEPIHLKNPNVPALDRTTGYRVRFNMQLDCETHVFTDRNGDCVSDRGGWSIIALSSDKKGVEIAFWESQAFAYDYVDVGGGVMAFVHAESTSGFDPTAGMTSYGLVIAGSSYTLSANGSAVLAGPLRDYSAEGHPYTIPSFLFLGDDTSSALSTTGLSYIAVDTAIPEPATLTLIGLGALAMLRRRRRPR